MIKVYPLKFSVAHACLAILILPVTGFAFGDPRDGLGYTFLFGFRALGFGDPVGIFAAGTEAKGFEGFGGDFVFLEGCGECGRTVAIEDESLACAAGAGAL